jgi:hypothetical protein
LGFLVLQGLPLEDGSPFFCLVRYSGDSLLFRHSGEGRNPFSPFVVPARLRHSREGLPCRHSGEGLPVVIPAKAGIHFDFVFAFFAWRVRDNRAFVPVGLRPPSLAGESLSLLAQRK